MTQDTGESRASFRTFMEEWSQFCRRDTPELHIKIADWLENCWRTGKLRLLLMAFRGSGKSTIAALFAAWLLYSNPDLRILVLAADTKLAGKMAQQIKKIIERHPSTEPLLPPKREQWAGSRFTVQRNSPLRDPSVQACGITMNITGSHADVIICDDVEVPKTCSTPEQREALRERLAEIDYILDPGGTQIYIGTPHSWFSIYADTRRTEAGEEKIFLDGFKRLEIPVQNGEGASAWPEKYPLDKIESIKEKSGPNKFASQMMLHPVSVNEGRLDPDLINIYGDDLVYAKELGGAIFLGERRMESASTWWDPAFGSKSGDRSVLAVTFQDGQGNIFLHHMEYMKVPKDAQAITSMDEKPPDRATVQCRRIGEIAKLYYLPSVTVENNGLGKFLPQWLQAELARMNVLCGVKEVHSTGSKDMRILGALDALMAAGKLWMHKSVLETPFINEMKEWRMLSKHRDDGLDALAGAVAQAPVRLARVYTEGRQSWQTGSKAHKAKTEFEV